MNSNLVTKSRSLSAMRQVLVEASLRLGVKEGSPQQEELALRILELFDSTRDADEVLAAALAHGQFDALDVEDEIALAQLGAAVILMWHEIGAPARAEMLRTAMTIAGVKKTADAGERLRRLISVHQNDPTCPAAVHDFAVDGDTAPTSPTRMNSGVTRRWG